MSNICGVDAQGERWHAASVNRNSVGEWIVDVFGLSDAIIMRVWGRGRTIYHNLTGTCKNVFVCVWAVSRFILQQIDFYYRNAVIFVVAPVSPWRTQLLKNGSCCCCLALCDPHPLLPSLTCSLSVIVVALAIHFMRTHTRTHTQAHNDSPNVQHAHTCA